MMDVDVKGSYRKSRAPWQSTNNNKINNPYANANTSIVTPSENNDSLQVPNPYANNTTSRKSTRRLSMHVSAAAQAHRKSFTQAAPFDLANLPQVPSLYKTSSKNSETILVTHEQDNEFVDIETKVVKELSNGTATEIDDYYKVLVKQKNLITRDIKASINQNQKYILELTNDLKETQDELLQLRLTTKELYGILDDFKDAAQRRIDLEFETQHQQQQQQELQTPKHLNKRKDRSSIMVLEKMWESELQSLFKHVEGASKYIQPFPGRHVLAESGRWYEVNAGTWKPTKATHLFILNDMLLIATKKSSQEGGNKSRLQAIQAWPLAEVKLSEISAPSSPGRVEDNKTYLINIKSKVLSYVYQTDRYDHFLKITEAYNKGRNELLRRDRLTDIRKTIHGPESGETDDEKRQLRESLRNSGFMENADEKRKSGSQRQSADIVLQDISARVHSRNRSHDFGNSLNDKSYSNADKGQFFNELKKIEDRLDEVDVEIAHNKYTESVGLVRYIENKLTSIESAIKVNNSENNASSSNNSIDEIKLLIDVIKLKINNRKVRVQQSLGFDLEHNIERLTHSEIYQITEFFYNFDQLDKGISLYLQAMSNYLSSTVSSLVVGVQGSTKVDVVNYLSNLVIINISIIKRAISVYKECIVPILKKDQRGNVDSSGLINWCVDEITKLVASIKKHLYGTLLTLAVNSQDDEPVYKVKDRKLFNEFLDIITPQLNELKSVGVNIDFVFDEIISLRE